MSTRLLTAVAVLLSSSALAEGARRCDERGLDFKAATVEQAQGLYLEGKPRDAQCLLEELTEAQPDNAEAWYWLAAAASDVGRDGRATAAVTRALALDPANQRAQVLAAYLAQDRGDVETARQLYRRFLAENPKTPLAEEVRIVLEQLPVTDTYARR